jgi:hypothetical protein
VLVVVVVENRRGSRAANTLALTSRSDLAVWLVGNRSRWLNDWPVGPHTCRQAWSMWLAGHSAQDENNQYENGIQLVIRTCRVATSVRTIHGRAGVFVAYDLAVRARGRCTCVAAVHVPVLIMYWLSFLIKIRKQKILVVWNSMGSRYKKSKIHD